MCFDNAKMGAQFKRAEKKHAKIAVIVGDNEIENGTVVIKNLTTTEQETVPIHTLFFRRYGICCHDYRCCAPLDYPRPALSRDSTIHLTHPFLAEYLHCHRLATLVSCNEHPKRQTISSKYKIQNSLSNNPPHCLVCPVSVRTALLYCFFRAFCLCVAAPDCLLVQDG